MANKTKPIQVSLKDLPLHCPTDEVALWCSHPRIYLDLSETGKANCPYCGTQYQLKTGVKAGHH
jgi:uncharacterized Zn-finger protein